MGQLPNNQIEDFINVGYVKIENAFSSELADECRRLLWKATKCDPEKPSTWKEPVVRITEMTLEPFKKAANTPVLHNAFDQLLGKDNWLPRTSLGSFPIRFPHKQKATDTGWHVDAGFSDEDTNDYFKWRVNINSKGRGLLMLFLFSDVAKQDAPTITKKSSHLDVARMLQPEGEKGLSFIELAQKLSALPQREDVLATGKAGTVYLCHPFIVHAAQDHRGTTPKFMAQPALHTKNSFNINDADRTLCAVERAILKGINSIS